MTKVLHNSAVEGHRGDAVAILCHTFRGYRAVWAIDFEFEAQHPCLPRPVVMVATDVLSGRTVTLGPGEFTKCPFACDGTEVFVAFFAVAEAGCFLALGWPMPTLWVDLFAEFKRLQNGARDGRYGLLQAMAAFGLPVRDAGHKKSMQELVGTGQWQPADVPAITEYCQEDVADTVQLLQRMMPHILSEAPGDATQAMAQAFIRGRFMAENARIEQAGLPVDVPTFALVRERWPLIRGQLIAEVDSHYGVYDAGRFSANRFAAYLSREQIPWPRLESGALRLDDDTFRQRAKAEPRVAMLRELREALSQVRGNTIAVDGDGRSRTPMRPLASKTGRSQPSTSRFLFGAAKWARSFIMAPEGHTFAYLDFKSQEIAIAAYLAGDELLAESYRSGDPYMAFAKAARLVPPDATKKSHPLERAACKAIVLGVAYGMGADAMAASSGVPVDMCRDLLLRHREAYRPFWGFVQGYRDRLALGLPAYTALGWRLQLGPGADVNERSNGNWPVQSTGSDILRVAVIYCARAGVPACATIHDALAFCVPTALADEMLTTAKAEMERAAYAVLGGHIGVDVTRYDWPHVYRDETGIEFYDRVVRLANAG
jgi:DNA polymerase-1